MSSLWRWARRAASAVVLILMTLIVGGACDARRRLPDLEAWHRIRLDEMTAATLDDRFTFSQYQAREEQLFAEVRALESKVEPGDRTPVNRYHPGSLSHPLSEGPRRAATARSAVTDLRCSAPRSNLQVPVNARGNSQGQCW